MNQFHSKCNKNSKTTTWIFHALCFALAMMHIDAEKNLTSSTGACVEKKVLKSGYQGVKIINFSLQMPL